MVLVIKRLKVIEAQGSICDGGCSEKGRCIMMSYFSFLQIRTGAVYKADGSCAGVWSLDSFELL